MGPWTGVPRGTKPALLATLLVGLTPSVALASHSDDPYASSLDFRGSSPDGTHAYVQTREQLVRADTDQMRDVYDIDHGVAKLVSFGPEGGNRDGTCLAVPIEDPPVVYTESCDARFQGASGGRVYFRSESLRSTEDENGLYGYYRDGDSLASTDGAIAETEDNAKQIVQDGNSSCLYQRVGGVSTLISTGPAVVGGGCPSNGDFHFVSQTDDGASVFFYSKQPLVAADTDEARDLYMSRNGATTLISTGPTDDGGAISHRYGTRENPFGPVSTADGDTVVFTTAASLVAADQDADADGFGADDIYLRSGSTTQLVSGPESASNVKLVGQSDDLGTIFFETTESLVPEDTNDYLDVYRWHSGTISLAAVDPEGTAFSGSSYLDSSADGTKLFFFGNASDSRSRGEIYERSGGVTTRLTAPGVDYQYRTDWAGASDDGSRAFFDSRRSLTGDDDDGGKTDLFRYANGALTLISTGPSAVDPADAEEAFAAGPGDPVSQDGSRVYFHTVQSMSPVDTDCGRTDFYEHSDTGNRLVTVGADAPTISPGPCAFDTATPTFDLVPANPGDGLECRIDQDPYKPCSSTFTQEINDGEHVLTVRGDAGTDPQSGVADRRFTVETDHPPETTITDGPTYSWDFQNPDQYRRPAFYFTSSEQTGHLECRFDDHSFELCDQSRTEAGSTGVDRPDEPLSFGAHSFEVRAVDGNGIADPTPEHRDFIVSPYDGDLELELSEPGVPGSLRSLAAGGLAPVVRCSKSCQVAARVTLRSKSKGKFRTIRFGKATGEAGLDATPIAVKPSSRAKRVLRKAKRVSVRIELVATPSDGDGADRTLIRTERLSKHH